MQGTDKAAMREQLLAARRCRSAAELDAARGAIRAHVLDRAQRDGWQSVTAYEPLATEPGSVLLLSELDDLDVTVLVPVLHPDNNLGWVRWSMEELPDRQELGVDAIAWVDAVLVPALAVSPDGARLGRGGGSYDRALARVPSGTPIAALLFDGEIREDVPADEWDIPVSAVVTPSGWRDLG